MKKHDDLRTPEWVYKPLGQIDLDPCAGPNTTIGITNWALERGENGLKRDWYGFVFCNPPFSQKELWIEKMLEHTHRSGDGGILLLPERGSAPWFGPLALAAGHYWVMGKKIDFLGGPSNNNLSSVMFLFGYWTRHRLVESGLPGHLVEVQHFKPR